MALNLRITFESVPPPATHSRHPPPIHIYTSHKVTAHFFETRTEISQSLIFSWAFHFSKALQSFLSSDRLPLLNIREGPVWYEMKYLVIPKAMNPSRLSHCKTGQIMRNTFRLANRHKEKEKGQKEMWSFVVSSWVAGNTRQEEWAEASSPPQSENTSRTDSWRVWPH